MQLDPADFAKLGGEALTSGTVQSAANKLGSYKKTTQQNTAGPVKVDWMGVTAERNSRVKMLEQTLRELEERRKEEEKKAATTQEQQKAFWDARAKSTGYSVDIPDMRTQAQKTAAKTASELKNQEREMSQYVKWLEAANTRDIAENSWMPQDAQRGYASDIDLGSLNAENQKARELARAIQVDEMGGAAGISANAKMAQALTDRQKDTFMAFVGRGDWDGATRYMDTISDSVNQQVAKNTYESMPTAGKALYWIPSGLDQFASGMAQLGQSEANTPSVTSRVSQMVREDAEEISPALGFAYDMGTSISNMAPSILLSMVAGPALGAAGMSAGAAGTVASGVGSAALGASAGGNAYAEKKRQGYGDDEAAAYATLVGASEAGLQYVLGGISKLGATPASKVAAQVAKIDNAFGQAALHLGANMLSEGVEEGLQSVLEPAFATLILDEKYQVSPQEVVTSFIMGALTAGILEGPGAVRAGKAGKTVSQNGGFDATIDGYLGADGVDYFRGVKNLEGTETVYEILKNYYSTVQDGAGATQQDITRQYTMCKAWYEGQEQARRATGTQQNTAQTAQEAQEQPTTVQGTQGQGWSTQAQQEATQPQREIEGLRLGAMWEDTQQEAQSQEGQFQRVQPAQASEPEGLTMGAMQADNNPSNTQNLNEGAGIHERTENAATTAGAATDPAGAGAFGGGQGRVYGEGTGQQAGILESRPGAAAQTSEQSRAASERLARAANLRGQEVSSTQLGISRGTDTANVLVMPQEMWDAEMTQVAQEVQQKTGATVTYVMGGMEVTHTDGSVGKVRGVQMPGQIIVQADHSRLSVSQIANHEAFHELASRDSEMVRTAEERIKARYDADEYNAVVATYIQKLQGVIDIPVNGTQEQILDAYYKILEEIYADAYAGINAFGVQASQYQETVQEVAQEREIAAPSRENARATERTTGPTSEDEVARETQRSRDIEETRRSLREAYANGSISEEAFDQAMDIILEQESLDDVSMLEIRGQEDGRERYSVNEEFQDDIEDWNRRGRPDDEVFIIGSTSDVLQGLGAIENDIYLRADKVNKILSKHREITLPEIKSIPQLIDDPVFILKSAGRERGNRPNTRMVLYGSVLARNRKPMLAVLDLQPVEGKLVINDMQKVNSVYTKDNPMYMLTNSDVLYADKKRTIPLLRSMGLHIGPKDLLQNGSIGRITYGYKSVKLDGVPFREVVDLSGRLTEEILTETEVGDDGNIYLPGGPVPEAVKRQRAKDEARSQETKRQEKFSVEDEEILTETEVGDDGNIYLPGGTVPEAVKRRRAVEQGTNTTGQSSSAAEQRATTATDNTETQAPKKKKSKSKKALKDTKAVAQSKAIIAKNDLNKTMMSLFSIPDGKKQMASQIIERYADKMIRDGELTYEDRNALFNRLYEEGVVTVEAEDLYQEGRRAVARGRVYVNEKVKGEFSDDWNSFYKRAFEAGVYLTNNPSDATPDSWNVELSQSFPGLFDPGELSERTILERIVEVAEEGKAEKMTLAEYTASMVGQEFQSLDDAMEGIERQMDWALRTFAEKANLELYLRDRTGRKIQQEREASAEARRAQEIRNQDARAKEREARRKIVERQRERRELSELQQKTLKQLQWLSKNRYRAPNELKKQFDEVLGDIDILAVNAANEMNWSKKHQATWKDLRQMYLTAQKQDPNFLPSPELERIVSRLDKDKIGDMDVDALGDLYRAAIGLRTEFYNRNNVLGSQKGELFSEVYRDAVDEITSAPKKLPGERGAVGEVADTIFNTELLTPSNVLQRMAGWAPEGAWHEMAMQLERGERDVRSYYVKANKMLENFLKENEAWVKTADGQGKNGVWHELEVPQLLELNMGDKPIFGDTVKVYMTPAQKVHLYLESKNTENLRHIAMGGRTFANKEIYSKGKRKEAFAAGKTIRLAPESVKKIVSDLTEQEMALANILEKYYNNFAREEMNRVSNILIGYDKAVSKDYAPIYTNENYSKSEIGVYETKAETVSRSKSRQEYASNATYNMSAFEAFERHVDDISRYVGMAIPARNWQTLMNWQVKDGSMKDSITHQWGQEGVDYINELLTDLQTSRRPDSSKVGKWGDALVSKYISSIFGLNPSIVLKQLGSIPLAMPYLGASNMPGLVKVAKIDRALISKYTQDLDYRLMGYSMPETKILKENPGKLQTNKVLNFTIGGGAITATDGWAASVLWPWAENKVRKEQPDLLVGSQEMIDSGQSPFYQAVAQEFERAVSRSQSTTATMFTSRLRKSRNVLARTLTLFKTDAAQGYNTLRQMVGEAQYYARKGDKKMANRLKLRFGQGVVGLLAGYLGSEGINLLMELWKRQGDKYKDEEGELQAESMAQDLVLGVVTSMFGLVPLAGELAELVASKMTGDKWYGMEVMGVEQINELAEYFTGAAGGIAETMEGAVDVLSKGGDLPKYLSDSSEKIMSWIRDAAKMAGQVFGLPVSNFETYFLGAMKWIRPELATAYEDMLGSGTKSNLSGLRGEALEARTQYILERRAGEVSMETVEQLAQLYEAGMADAIPAEPTYKIKTSDGEREMTAAERQLYDAAWGEVGKSLEELVQSQEFQNFDRAKKTSALKTLYDYAKAKADAAVNPEHEVEKSEAAIDTFLKEGGTIEEWATLKAGTKDLQSGDKYRAIAESDMTEDAKIAAIGAEMGTEMKTVNGNPSQYAKMLKVLEYGTDLDEYLDLREEGEVDAFLAQVEAGVNIDADTFLRAVKAIEAVDDNGSITQAEAEEGLRNISGLTDEERAELWQLQDKRWKPEKNPFDVDAGRRILSMIQG
ncbi:hypothetical protein [Pseudoflavonifractor sp. An85]|uniref:MuF-C-terminal domain-containing protein n=1 Tax=Pseudoflavonifractor sp. An85 TaxID=1965661 RepID=UPI00117A7B82|nr:hypothetical protein [Pseudoflavonifractor sp. An85]